MLRNYFYSNFVFWGFMYLYWFLIAFSVSISKWNKVVYFFFRFLHLLINVTHLQRTLIVTIATDIPVIEVEYNYTCICFDRIKNTLQSFRAIRQILSISLLQCIITYHAFHEKFNHVINDVTSTAVRQVTHVICIVLSFTW